MDALALWVNGHPEERTSLFADMFGEPSPQSLHLCRMCADMVLPTSTVHVHGFCCLDISMSVIGHYDSCFVHASMLCAHVCFHRVLPLWVQTQ